MSSMMGVLSFDNPVFSSYVFCTSALALKMLGLALKTSITRVRTGTYANPEDVIAFGKDKEGKPIFNNDKVERVRRNHQNDLENLTPFAVLGLLYVLSKPDPSTAVWHFRVFAASRFLHTLCYQTGIAMPRFGFFLLGVGTTVSIGIQLLRKSW